MTLNDSIKIYSLNKNNMYEVILSHDYKDNKNSLFNINIKDIYEIDPNNFIFCILESYHNNNVYQNFNDINAYREIFDYDYKIKKITFNNIKPSMSF